MGRDDYQVALKTMHTNAVPDSIQALGANHVIGTEAPPIDETERALFRHERTALAQLRSGDSIHLKEDQMPIGKSEDATCPECKFRRETSPHLFGCDATPTVLLATDLWAHPVAVVNHLRKLPSFSGLKTHDPPPPRPPPEPPP